MFTKSDLKLMMFKTSLISIFGASYIFINSIGVNPKKTSIMLFLMIFLTFSAIIFAENKIQSREDVSMLMLKAWVTLTHEWSIATLLSYMTSEQISLHFVVISTLVFANSMFALALAPIAYLALTSTKPPS